MLCALPFGKHEQIRAMVHHFTSKHKAPPKAALLRHRKDIEEENDRHILEQIEQASEQGRSRLWMKPFSQLFPIHGDRHSGSESSRKRQQNQRVIHHAYVVADEY